MPALSSAVSTAQALKLLERRIDEYARGRGRLAHGRWHREGTTRVDGNGVMPCTVPELEPVGCSMSSGMITVQRAGRYNMQATAHVQPAITGTQWLWLCPGEQVDPRWGGTSIDCPVAEAWYMLGAVAVDVPLAAGDTVVARVYFSQGENGTYFSAANRWASNIAIQQIA